MIEHLGSSSFWFQVVSKLAKQISIDCCSRCALHLSSAERVARIKARTCFPFDNRQVMGAFAPNGVDKYVESFSALRL